ncbi:hypothetical protein C8J56DRAFT_902049 [Mycena floridula]|nr:hypothetical protein C8J56DRAFT_902049 [Mycena floridula]
MPAPYQLVPTALLAVGGAVHRWWIEGAATKKDKQMLLSVQIWKDLETLASSSIKDAYVFCFYYKHETKLRTLSLLLLFAFTLLFLEIVKTTLSVNETVSDLQDIEIENMRECAGVFRAVAGIFGIRTVGRAPWCKDAVKFTSDHTVNMNQQHSEGSEYGTKTHSSPRGTARTVVAVATVLAQDIEP